LPCTQAIHARRHIGLELGIGAQQAGAGVGQDVIDLVAAEAVVDGQHDGAQVTDGQAELDEGRAVLHQQRHHLARPDAAGAQAARDQAHSLRQLTIADRLAVVDHGGSRGRRARPMQDGGTERNHAKVLLSRSAAYPDRAGQCNSGSFPRRYLEYCSALWLRARGAAAHRRSPAGTVQVSYSVFFCL
jgi:hypothetical protein